MRERAHRSTFDREEYRSGLRVSCELTWWKAVNVEERKVDWVQCCCLFSIPSQTRAMLTDSNGLVTYTCLYKPSVEMRGTCAGREEEEEERQGASFRFELPTTSLPFPTLLSFFSLSQLWISTNRKRRMVSIERKYSELKEGVGRRSGEERSFES